MHEIARNDHAIEWLGLLSILLSGGRKIIVVSEGLGDTRIMPTLQLYRLGQAYPEESKQLLVQPSLDMMSWRNGVVVFFTPPQPSIDVVIARGFEVRLGLMTADDHVTGSMLAFSIIPHDNGGLPCFQCATWPDSPIPVGGVCEANQGSGTLHMPARHGACDDYPLNLTVPRNLCLDSMSPRLRRTQSQVKRGTVSFKCVYCGHVLTRRQTLRSHIEKFHPMLI